MGLWVGRWGPAGPPQAGQDSGFSSVPLNSWSQCHQTFCFYGIFSTGLQLTGCFIFRGLDKADQCVPFCNIGFCWLS